MAKLTISLGGSVLREFEIDQERITIGRRPSNDIVLDDSTVSGNHAAILNLQNVYVEDLGSTNGTLLNGKPVQKRMLSHGDVIGIGQHELRFVDERAQDFEQTVLLAPGEQKVVEAPAHKACITVMDGPKAGESLTLAKSYTTVGKPGVQVAVVAQRSGGYFLTPLSGGVGSTTGPIRINEEPISGASVPLKEGDVVEVAGIRMRFSLAC